MNRRSRNWQPDHVEDRLRMYGDGYRPGTCEKCGKRGLRHVHIISRRDPNERKRVGACCAELLVSNYDATGKQRKLKNQYDRVCRIPKRKGWHESQNNKNQTIVIEGCRLTIFRDTDVRSRFRFSVNCGDRPEYSKRTYKNEFDAKIAAAWKFADLAGWFGEESISDDDRE